MKLRSLENSVAATDSYALPSGVAIEARCFFSNSSTDWQKAAPAEESIKVVTIIFCSFMRHNAPHQRPSSAGAVGMQLLCGRFIFLSEERRLSKQYYNLCKKWTGGLDLDSASTYRSFHQVVNVDIKTACLFKYNAQKPGALPGACTEAIDSD